MPIRVRNAEASVATDDASSNAAGFKKNISGMVWKIRKNRVLINLQKVKYFIAILILRAD